LIKRKYLWLFLGRDFEPDVGGEGFPEEEGVVGVPSSGEVRISSSLLFLKFLWLS
jgi:hypothetical protein